MNTEERRSSSTEGNAARGAGLRALLSRFRRDESGNYLMIGAIAMPALLGIVGLGTENGIWLYTHQTEQSATDAAAFSAAQSYAINGPGSGSGSGNAGTNVTTEANAIAANYGFVSGQNNTTVTINRPPKSGSLTTAPNAIEVIITQTQPRLFSALWKSDLVTIRARSVALGNAAKGCVLALNGVIPKAADSSGGGNVNINNCDLYDDSKDAGALNGGGSAIVHARVVGVVGGVVSPSSFVTSFGLLTGFPVVPDPYADVPVPTTLSCNGQYNSNKSETIAPGCWKNMTFNAGNTVNFAPGIYYVYGGSFKVNGGASLTCTSCVRGGDGVTIVLTGDATKGYATATVNGGGTISLQAPGKNSTMATKGIVFFADRSAPVGTSYKFTGDASMNFIGAIYAPKGAISWSGGQGTSTSCTQVIGDTVNFAGGGSNLAVNCEDDGTRPIGLNTMVVE